MIRGRLWIKKHEVIIDITNDSLAFWSGHCTPIGATSPTILSKSRLPPEIAVDRIEQDITPRKMIKKDSKEDMTDFL